ncbi:hypothetical protein UPYG_G00013060 [Umbra pygmaea]|uniref:Ig-like domain-containing protein n=1 Tax=Umbra pygmaea TaxID=75934 RepID=A0ABD0Y006_UMBPY
MYCRLDALARDPDEECIIVFQPGGDKGMDEPLCICQGKYWTEFGDVLEMVKRCLTEAFDVAVKVLYRDQTSPYVVSNRMKTAANRVKETNAVMALKVAGRLFVVLIVLVAAFEGALIQSGCSVTYNRTRICAVKDSSVNLSCSYTFPSGHTVMKTSWYIRKHEKNVVYLNNDPEYSLRVKYHGDKDHDCTLTMTDLRQNDTAEYSFELETSRENYTGSPGVFLTVTDVLLEISPLTVSEGENATLTCVTKCTLGNNTAFVWYKNRKLIQNSHAYSNSLHLGPVSSEDALNYSCAVKNHEKPSSPEVALTVRYSPRNMSVSVSPSGEIEQGTAVTLTCNSDANPPVNKYAWHKKYKNPYTELPEQGQHYIFNNISSEEIGEYKCIAWNEMGAMSSQFVSVNVRFSPKNISVSVSPAGEIVAGSTVNLTCNSDAYPPVTKYTWFKKTISLGVITVPGNVQSYIIKNITYKDSGDYTCNARNEMGGKSSKDVLVRVTDISVSVSPYGIIVEGRKVTLTCNSDPEIPVTKYTWYKKTKTSQSLQVIGQQKTYIINNIRAIDSGEYICNAQNDNGGRNSSLVSVHVRFGPKNVSVTVNPSGELVVGSTVTLTCSSDAYPPVIKYTWFKNNVTLPKASGQVYNLTAISDNEVGVYYCEAQNNMGAKNSTGRSITVSGKQSSSWTAAIGITVVTLTVTLTVLFLLVKMKRASESTGEVGQEGSGHLYDTLSDTIAHLTVQRTNRYEENISFSDVYCSVSKDQTDPYYAVQPHDINQPAIDTKPATDTAEDILSSTPQ